MNPIITSMAVAIGAIVFRSVFICGAKFVMIETKMSPYELLYMRFAFTLPLMLLMQMCRSSTDAKNSVWNVSRQQALYVFFRALGSCLSSVLQNYAL